MEILGNIIGTLATIMFVLSYQMKTRRWIIVLNAGSRILYVIQYILLGAPFWLVYNTLNKAYGSSAGNIITLVSIAVAIIRYDILKREKKR